MRITKTIHIQEDELSETFIRATGPGGQNVNKVSSAVQLRFDVTHSKSLPEDVRLRLFTVAQRYMTKDGVLIITAQRYRTQQQNRQDARNRLAELIHKALWIPKMRIPTRPTKSSKEQRLKDKHKHSTVKMLRKTVKEF